MFIEISLPQQPRTPLCDATLNTLHLFIPTLSHLFSIHAEVGARAVAKSHPEEKVGVFALRGEAMTVLEYSELDPKLAGQF